MMKLLIQMIGWVHLMEMSAWEPVNGILYSVEGVCVMCQLWVMMDLLGLQDICSLVKSQVLKFLTNQKMLTMMLWHLQISLGEITI